MSEREDEHAEVVAALRAIPVEEPAWRESPGQVVARGRLRHRRIRAVRTGAGALSIVAVLGLAGVGVANRGGDGLDLVPASPSVTRTEPTAPPTGAPGAALIEMPMVVGMERAAAVELVNQAGLTLPEGSVSTEPSAAVPPDHVLRQVPAAGQKLPRGSRVQLAVALAPVPPSPSRPGGEGAAGT